MKSRLYWLQNVHWFFDQTCCLLNGQKRMTKIAKNWASLLKIKCYKIGSYKKMSFGFLNLISLNEKNQRNSDGL